MNWLDNLDNYERGLAIPVLQKRHTTDGHSGVWQ